MAQHPRHPAGHPVTVEGRPIKDEELLAELRRLRLLAGIRPIKRAHDLRHQAASLMLANGYRIKAVQTVLRHKKPSITLDIYTHLVPDKPVERPRPLADVFPYRAAERQQASRATDSRLPVAAASISRRNTQRGRRAVRPGVRSARHTKNKPPDVLSASLHGQCR